MARSSVDLPQPDGPSMVTKLASGTSKSTLSKAVMLPASPSKRTTSSLTEIAAAAEVAASAAATAVAGVIQSVS